MTDDKKLCLSDLEAQIRAEVRDNFDEEAGATDFDPSDWLDDADTKEFLELQTKIHGGN